MKKILVFTGLIAALGLAIQSCDSNRVPGKIYMPDMTYSRAYETYRPLDSARFTMDALSKGGNKIYFNGVRPAGAIKRGEVLPYPLPNDSNGYKMSYTIKNPFTDSLSKAEMDESGRLFNINCGICHGEKGAGNGPLSTGGKIGGVANLTLPNYVAMADGTMYHSIEYGKGVMGSYASQLSGEQRWKIIKYIRKLQNGTGAAASTTATADSTKKS